VALLRLATLVVTLCAVPVVEGVVVIVTGSTEPLDNLESSEWMLLLRPEIVVVRDLGDRLAQNTPFLSHNSPPPHNVLGL